MHVYTYTHLITCTFIEREGEGRREGQRERERGKEGGRNAPHYKSSISHRQLEEKEREKES